MSKVLLIGQAPSRSAGHLRAFDGASGRRLARLLGLSMGEFFEDFDTVNLLRRWPGKHGGRYAYRDKGDRLPLVQARKRARLIEQCFGSRPVVVFAGSRTARAFGYFWPFFNWFDRRDGGLAFVLPHPSGTNLMYNEPSCQTRACDFLIDATKLARARLSWGDALRAIVRS